MDKPKSPSVDFSAPGPDSQESTQANKAASQVEDNEKPRLPVPDQDYLKQERWNDIERRVMRYSLFAVIMFFAIFFLSSGLYFALKVGDGLLTAKKDIVKALTGHDVSQCIVPIKCVPAPSKGVSEAVANLNADWLSASSMIMIVAFILGVGLTLILTLLKSSFRHPTDNSLKNEENRTSLELATPLSELISGIISYLKDKFSK